MKRGVLKIMVSVMLTAALLFCAAVQASALDDKYEFDDLGMTVKIPKSYTVVTRNAERDDEAFSLLNLDYDETITAFNTANIYLQAFSEDGLFKITLTAASDDSSREINNYSDLTAAQRKELLDNFLADEITTSAVEIKHGGNIFFDLTLETETDGVKMYINQDNTVINGMNINLTLQKPDEPITTEEAKALSNAANSLSFDKIVRKNAGPAFDWWRILLWVIIMAAISFAISFIYKQYNNANKRKLEERRHRHVPVADTDAVPYSFDENGELNAPVIAPKPLDEDEDEAMSFDEVLGYESGSQFQQRAATDLESFDFNVREKDPNAGVNFFEDSGESIDDGSDYFDTYFKEPTESRPAAARAATTVGTYIKIGFRHVGYFFQNLFRMIAGLFKKKKK